MTFNRSMARHVLDVLLAAAALFISTPLLCVAAFGIALASPGPILYRAPRIGRDRRRMAASVSSDYRVTERRHAGYRGREVIIYKLRTMHISASAVANPITSRDDVRVFHFGAWLRAMKIDELPQLLNVIRGEMALVGPRPEAPEIVRRYYRAEDLLTLQVLPGLTSPGSLYYYTHSEAALGTGDVTQFYVERLLPVKLAIDRVYINNATLAYDIRIMLRTLGVIAAKLLGRQRFSEPPQMAQVHYDSLTCDLRNHLNDTRVADVMCVAEKASPDC